MAVENVVVKLPEAGMTEIKSYSSKRLYELRDEPTMDFNEFLEETRKKNKEMCKKRD